MYIYIRCKLKTYENKYYLDGACIDNYPINLFKNELDNVIVVYVCDKYKYTNSINNIEEYLIHVIQHLL